MKKSLVCLVCLCFPLIAITGETKPTHHENCKIEIYSNFIKLKDINKQTVEYNFAAVSAIQSLFISRGYEPVAGFYPGVMSLNIESFLREEEREMVTPEEFMSTRGEFYTQKLYCWDVTATIKGNDLVYKNKYSACRDSESPNLYEETDNYVDKIMGDAFHFSGSLSSTAAFDDEMTNVIKDLLASETVSGYNPPAIVGYQFTGGPLADSIEAVLLGASAETIKEYKEIPSNIGILKNIPYCCTPQNKTPRCIASRELKKN